jgi:spermidine/putrescine transport system permease protein
MAAAVRGVSSRGNWLTVALLTPTAAWFLVMLVMPLIVVVIFSFGERSPMGGYGAGFTFEQYANLPARFTAFKNTMTYAPLGTIISLLIAYPLAYYLAVKVDRRWKLLLLVLVIVPFWTSLLIRTYAWIFILGGRWLTCSCNPGIGRSDRPLRSRLSLSCSLRSASTCASPWAARPDEMYR